MTALRRGCQLALGWIFCALYLSGVVIFSILTLGRFRQRLGDAIIRCWGRVLMAVSLVQVDVEGVEHLAGEQPRIVVFNHASLLDDFIVCTLMPRRSLPIVKRELLSYPFIGWAMRCLDFVAIDRRNALRAAASLNRAAARINGERLTVFIAPEGTRSRDGRLGRFKLGAIRLALASGAPLVPLVIHGARDRQPMGQWAADPGRVLVRVLPPINTTGFREDSLAAHADQLRALFERELRARPATQAASGLLDADYSAAATLTR